MIQTISISCRRLYESAEAYTAMRAVMLAPGADAVVLTPDEYPAVAPLIKASVESVVASLPPEASAVIEDVDDADTIAVGLCVGPASLAVVRRAVEHAAESLVVAQLLAATPGLAAEARQAAGMWQARLDSLLCRGEPGGGRRRIRPRPF